MTEYENMIYKARYVMDHPEESAKEFIIKAAEILEKNKSVPLDQICAKIIKDCKGKPSPTHIRNSLPEKYKEIEKRNKPMMIDNSGNTLTDERYSNATQVLHPNDYEVERGEQSQKEPESVVDRILRRQREQREEDAKKRDIVFQKDEEIKKLTARVRELEMENATLKETIKLMQEGA